MKKVIAIAAVVLALDVAACSTSPAPSAFSRAVESAEYNTLRKEWITCASDNVRGYERTVHDAHIAADAVVAACSEYLSRLQLLLLQHDVDLEVWREYPKEAETVVRGFALRAFLFLRCRRAGGTRSDCRHD